MSDFKSKLCPFLSGALVSQQIQKNVAEDDREAVSCQGPACALFMTILDESGQKAVGGNCAVTLTANALAHINITVARTAEKVAPGSTTNLIAKG